MNELITALLLGVVEGITEFLPISSTGHLILVNKFISFTGAFPTLFDVVIQCGAILAVLLYFRKKMQAKNIQDQKIDLAAVNGHYIKSILVNQAKAFKG